MSSSSSSEPLCELCGDAEIDGGCSICEHRLCEDCYRYCPTCEETVCRVCDAEGLEQLQCDKCTLKTCLHGQVVGFDYKCSAPGCKGTLEEK